MNDVRPKIGNRETWEIPKQTGETIGETRGNIWGNGENM